MIYNKALIAMLLLFGIFITFTGIAYADPGVNATPETQTLSTVTNADVLGLAMETDAVTWSLTSGSRLAASWYGEDDHLEYYESQYTTAYDGNIVAQAGHTVYTKTMNVDTRNKVSSQSNINAETGLTYIATADGGNVIGSQNIMLDGVGDTTTAADKMLCPFASSPDGIIPAFCNIVQSGSKYDLTVGSVTTKADERFVGNDATNPVVLNYAINVKPYGTTEGQIPAIGSTSAYIKAHVQEAYVGEYYEEFPEKVQDLTYSETGSAQGTITAFNKVMSYSSQVTSVAIRPNFFNIK